MAGRPGFINWRLFHINADDMSDPEFLEMASPLFASPQPSFLASFVAKISRAISKPLPPPPGSDEEDEEEEEEDDDRKAPRFTLFKDSI
jgi:hypothetical protein